MDIWRKSRYIVRSFIILIFCWLGWLCGLAFGHVSEAFTSAANFPDAGLTCLANLAAFYTFILQGKGWYENKAKENAAIGNVEEKNINGLKIATTCGERLQVCSVVLLSFHDPATSSAMEFLSRNSTAPAREFLSRISGVYDVHSIVLPCNSLQCETFTEDLRKCSCTENRDGRCRCIGFKTVEDITMMLARRLPGTLKRLPNSHCLIPSVRCMRNGCHGCNEGLLHIENDILTEGDPHVASPAAVCEILDQLESIPKVRAWFCIPVHPSNEDEWTNQLIGLFKPEDKEFRGFVFRKGGISASSALENYKNGNRECDADETYSLASLAILPYLTRPLINLVLTFCLKVDCFSSAVFAIRAVGSYYNSPSMLTRACVKSNANSTNVCQVLFFRPEIHARILMALWFIPTIICIIGWTVLVAMEGGAHKWYHIQSMAPSEGRIIVIIVGICIALAMDVFDLKLYLRIRRRHCFRRFSSNKFCIFPLRSFSTIPIDLGNIFLFCTIIGLQLLYIVGCIAIGRIGGIKSFGRWIYSALQCLVLAKWLSFCFILNNCQDAIRQHSPEDGKAIWWYGTCGHYISSSAFLLNATLAAVRSRWIFS